MSPVNPSSSTSTNHRLTTTAAVPFSGLDWNLNSQRKRKTSVVNLLRLVRKPTAPSFTTDNEFENILQQMIERYTILDSEANNLVRRQGRLWEMVGMDDKRLTVSQAQRERLNYVVIRDHSKRTARTLAVR